MAYFYSPFRKSYAVTTNSSCSFCDHTVIAKQIVHTQDGGVVENASYCWVVNNYPKFEGHTMIVPKYHLTDIGEETPKQLADREELIRYGIEVFKKVFPGCGIELFLQTGIGSQSSINHLHWHLVPASPNDPLRSFDKLGQFYTVEPGKERILLFPVEIQRSPKELLEILAQHAPSL